MNSEVEKQFISQNPLPVNFFEIQIKTISIPASTYAVRMVGTDYRNDGWSGHCQCELMEDVDSSCSDS